MKVMNNDIVTLLGGHNMENEARPRRGIKTTRQGRGCTFAASRHTSLIYCEMSTTMCVTVSLHYLVKFHFSHL